ncbi:uncharacterized protein A4U43_C08F22200 [Asparagus officinalis]|nr:uncharacterized protein A4U43_C08F22200 [Asparagus officinalis]
MDIGKEIPVDCGIREAPVADISEEGWMDGAGHWNSSSVGNVLGLAEGLKSMEAYVKINSYKCGKPKVILIKPGMFAFQFDRELEK